MRDALIRKARQVLADPVLQRWLLRRIAGLEKSPAGFTAGHPPYLEAEAEKHQTVAVTDLSPGSFSVPTKIITIDLPGKSVELSPEDPSALFSKPYADLETLLGAHRFAWVPTTGEYLDPDWVDVLWRCWTAVYGQEESGWPWNRLLTTSY